MAFELSAETHFIS